VRGRIAERRRTRGARWRRSSSTTARGTARFGVVCLGERLQDESKGVNAQCEYPITGPGVGTGACLVSGAQYQMHSAGW